jgi:hypothetical protein
VDDGNLQRAVYAALRGLQETKEVQAEGEREGEEWHQRALESALWDLDRAQHALQVARMQPPTTAVAQACERRGFVEVRSNWYALPDGLVLEFLQG